MSAKDRSSFIPLSCKDEICAETGRSKTFAGPYRFDKIAIMMFQSYSAPKKKKLTAGCVLIFKEKSDRTGGRPTHIAHTEAGGEVQSSADQQSMV